MFIYHPLRPCHTRKDKLTVWQHDPGVRRFQCMSSEYTEVAHTDRHGVRTDHEAFQVTVKKI